MSCSVLLDSKLTRSQLVTERVHLTTQLNILLTQTSRLDIAKSIL